MQPGIQTCAKPASKESLKVFVENKGFGAAKFQVLLSTPTRFIRTFVREAKLNVEIESWQKVAYSN